MNNLDMYTREKANKIHLEELHREAQNHYMLRDGKRKKEPKNITVKRRGTITRTVSILIAAIASFLSI
jgi:hypothetical protein